MRLVTRKLWRAFPELDRFDDAQCARFVSAAARGAGHRVLRWGLVLIAGCIGVVLLPGLEVLESVVVGWRWMREPFLEPALQKPRWMAELVYLPIAMTVVFSLGGLLGAVTRDLMLRWRVRRVLTTRGRCAGCDYFLGGLPVDDALKVVCPECGFITEVDSSLGELEAGADGAARFAPSAQAIKASDPWLTRQRVGKWARRTAAVMAVILFVVGSVVGWHEWRIRRQAARAAALKPGGDALMVLAEREQLKGGDPPEGAVNAFELLTPLVRKMSQAETSLFPQGPPQVEGLYITIEGSWVAARPEPDEDEKAIRERTANEPYSTQMLREFERVGVFDDARAIANAPLAISALNVPPNQPLAMAMWGTNYAAMRKLARWEGARMRLAAAADDPAAFADAFDNTLGYAAMMDKQPELMGRLVAVAVEALAYNELRAALRQRHDAKWLDALERVWKKREAHASPALPFEGGKISARDLVCWFFADPNAARLGRYSPGLKEKFTLLQAGLPEEGRLGTLEENLAVIDAFYDSLIADAKLPRAQRTGGAERLVSTDLILPGQLLPGMSRALNSQDQIGIDRAATPVLLALERFRLAKGAYPQTLAELTPAYLPAAPVDPWTGKGFGYRVVEPKSDRQGRGFLLYGFGTDGVDDSGREPAHWWEALHDTGTTGYDLIINDENR